VVRTAVVVELDQQRVGLLASIRVVGIAAVPKLAKRRGCAKEGDSFGRCLERLMYVT
jgi:hypothetical protein